MAKKKFIKYAFEDIRTDYVAFDEDTHKAPANTIESRNVVTFDGTSKILVTSDSDVNNTTVFMLAEDVKPEDYGMVIYIIENNDNLETETVTENDNENEGENDDNVGE